MKNAKKMLALIIALVMVAAIAIPAMADTTGSTVTAMKFTYEGTDATTNGKISLDNATKDTTYTLYKIFDATYSLTDPTIVSYTIKDVPNVTTDLYDVLKGSAWEDYFTIATVADADGNFAVTRPGTVTNGTFTPTKSDAELIAQLKTLDTSLFTNIGAIKASGNGAIEWDQIPYGYYMIVPDKPANTAVVTIDTNNPTAQVIDKNNVPEFDKNIVIAAANTGDEATLQKWIEAGLDISVPFQIDLIAQNYDGVQKIFQYAVYDTLDNGFTLTSLPVVKIDGTDYQPVTTFTSPISKGQYSIAYKNAAGNAITVTDVASAASAQSFEIIIPWTKDGTVNGDHLYDPNTTVQVTYSAKLDPAKADKVKIGNIANDNTADVKYWKDTDTPDKPNGDLPDKKTKTWATSLTIQKQDNKGKELTGAEFTLTTNDGTKVSYVYKEEYVLKTDGTGTHYKLKDGTFTTTAPTTETANYYDDTSKMYKLEATYGVVGAGQTVSNMTAAVGADGKVTFSGLGTGHYTLSETKVPTGFNRIADISFEIDFAMVSGFDPDDVKDSDGKFSTPQDSPITLDADNNIFSITIVNNPGQELPSTGGIGTTIFYIIGGILVVGAGVVLVARKKTKDD